MTEPLSSTVSGSQESYKSGVSAVITSPDVSVCAAEGAETVVDHSQSHNDRLQLGGRVVDFLLRVLVAGLFFDAGIQKIQDPTTFAEQIANYQLFSEWAAYGAVLLPSVEIVAAIVAVLGPRRWNRSAILVIVGMLVMFTLAISQAWWRGINTDCGCFGQGSTPIGIWTVLRNSGLLIACGLSLWLSRNGNCIRVTNRHSSRSSIL